MTVHAPPRTLLDQLEEAGIDYQLIPHRRSETAAAEAEALGVAARAVAKTIVLVTPVGLALAVIPASERLDLHKVRALLDSKKVAAGNRSCPRRRISRVRARRRPGDRCAS